MNPGTGTRAPEHQSNLRTALGLENPGKRQCQAWQKRRGENVSGVKGHLDRTTEPLGVPAVDPDEVQLWIRDPVFGYARTLV